MREHWQAGQAGRASGVLWRVVQGKKSDDDLRLELRLNGEWVAVTMELGFLMADFFFENEQVLYPRERGAKGGYKYLQALHRAAKHGFRSAAGELCGEQRAKRRRSQPASKAQA